MALATTQAAQLKNFLDELLTHVPEDKRDSVRATYSKAQDTVTTIDTAIQQVNQTAAQQRQWWESNKDAVDERNRLRGENEQLKSTKPNDQQVDVNAIQKAIDASRNEVMDTGLGLATTLTDLGLQHYKEFGEALNTRELAQKAIEARKPLDQFYAESMAPRRQERQTAEQTKAVQDAEERGRQAGMQEGMKAAGKALPYPTANAPVTTLAGLRKPADGASPYSLEAAVATAMSVANEQNK